LLLSTKGEAVRPVFDNLKKSDIGISTGVGIEIPIAASAGLLAEFRYSPSFSDAFRNSALTVRNRSFEILLGAQF
jgi:hypothetical protein